MKAEGKQELINAGYKSPEEVSQIESNAWTRGWLAHQNAGYQYTADDVSNAYYNGLNQGHQDFYYVGDGAGDYVYVGGY